MWKKRNRNNFSVIIQARKILKQLYGSKLGDIIKLDFSFAVGGWSTARAELQCFYFDNFSNEFNSTNSLHELL